MSKRVVRKLRINLEDSTKVLIILGAPWRIQKGTGPSPPKKNYPGSFNSLKENTKKKTK